MVHFCESLSKGKVANFDELVSQGPATLIIGSAPGEWLTERDGLRFPFEVEGVRLEVKDPVAYEEGTLGWAVNQTSFFFPDGWVMQSRLTARTGLPPTCATDSASWPSFHRRGARPGGGACGRGSGTYLRGRTRPF